MSNAYKQSGVDIHAGYESVEKIKSHVASTKIKGAMDSIGAFGGMFDLGCLSYQEPVLVSGTDGVGSKILCAIESDTHDTIGIDGVAMCVNDVIVQGAKPLFFLDYLALHKNIPDQVASIVAGVANGCRQSGCALIGGETAEMRDLYEEGHYDLAGFCVGVVEKSKLITGEKLRIGDRIIGLASSGIHSNGYSLVRSLLFKQEKMRYDQILGSKTVAEHVLTPTKIYVKPILSLLETVDVHAMSHITGGGFYENLGRILQPGTGIEVDAKSFPKPEIFEHLQTMGNISNEEMYNVFNMGIGYCVVVAPEDEQATLQLLQAQGEDAYVIGEVVGEEGVRVTW
ncbi:MAG: phosphoribosylformylglycinamidine cyclo-ligase [Erysipelotrichaceae bacterium]